LGLSVELDAEVIDLRDQLVDALGDVLSPLIGLQELLVEIANALVAGVDLLAKRSILLLQTSVAIHQRCNRLLQSLEISYARLAAPL
jgi:hypothetical protein